MAKRKSDTLAKTHERDIVKLEKVLTRHIREEDETFKLIREDLKGVHDRIAKLDEIKVNGRVGVEAGLQDIYREVKEMRGELKMLGEVTQTARSWADLRASFRALYSKSALFAPFRTKSKIVNMLLLAFGLLLLNTVLHPFGVDWSLGGLLEIVRKAAGI